ncbi:MAG: hypothetical protein R3F08_06525 [Dokdonella sp.]
MSAVFMAWAFSANRPQERLLSASTWPFLQNDSGKRADDCWMLDSIVLGDDALAGCSMISEE